MIGETAWFLKLEGEYHYMGESHAAHLSAWMTGCGQGVLFCPPGWQGEVFSAKHQAGKGRKQSAK